MTGLQLYLRRVNSLAHCHCYVSWRPVLRLGLRFVRRPIFGQGIVYPAFLPTAKRSEGEHGMCSGDMLTIHA